LITRDTDVKLHTFFSKGGGGEEGGKKKEKLLEGEKGGKVEGGKQKKGQFRPNSTKRIADSRTTLPREMREGGRRGKKGTSPGEKRKRTDFSHFSFLDSSFDLVRRIGRLREEGEGRKEGKRGNTQITHYSAFVPHLRKRGGKGRKKNR